MKRKPPGEKARGKDAALTPGLCRAEEQAADGQGEAAAEAGEAVRASPSDSNGPTWIS